MVYRRLRHQDAEFKARFGYMVSPCLKERGRQEESRLEGSIYKNRP